MQRTERTSLYIICLLKVSLAFSYFYFWGWGWKLSRASAIVFQVNVGISTVYERVFYKYKYVYVIMYVRIGRTDMRPVHTYWLTDFSANEISPSNSSAVNYRQMRSLKRSSKWLKLFHLQQQRKSQIDIWGGMSIWSTSSLFSRSWALMRWERSCGTFSLSRESLSRKSAYTEGHSTEHSWQTPP